MIDMTAYLQDKDEILNEIAELQAAIGNLKVVCADDPHVVPVAYFMEKRVQAIKDVFTNRRQEWDKRLVEFEKEFADEEFKRRKGEIS